MTIVKQGETFIITGVTLGKLLAIANALNFKKNANGLTDVGEDILLMVNREIESEKQTINNSN